MFELIRKYWMFFLLVTILFILTIITNKGYTDKVEAEIERNCINNAVEICTQMCRCECKIK